MKSPLDLGYLTNEVIPTLADTFKSRKALSPINIMAARQSQIQEVASSVVVVSVAALTSNKTVF